MTKPSPTRRLLNLEEAAVYTEFSARYIQEQTRAGRITVVKIPGGSGRRLATRWRPQDLDAFIEQHVVPARTPESPSTPPAPARRRGTATKAGRSPVPPPRGTVNARDAILHKESAAS